MEKKTVILFFVISLCVAVFATVGIRLLDPLLDRFSHLSDQGPTWYYWKLPEPDTMARITAWVGYGLQQIFTWLFVAAVMKSRKEKKPQALRLTLSGLMGTGIFIILHLVQTHLFYDGLAQDVPIFTSQDSVIGMLMIIIALLIPVRGIFFGKKIPLARRALEFIRNYHGYFIGWALVYTFWFHPMDGDWELVIGFLYMFLLFIQVCFSPTFLHLKLAWITLLEVFVAIHGTVVALLAGQTIWPMFLFGFLFLFIVTQMHGLKLPLVVRIGAIVLYVIGAGVVYYFRGYERLFEITFIPIILYGGALLLTPAIQAGQWFVRKLAGLPDGVTPKVTAGKNKPAPARPPR